MRVLTLQKIDHAQGYVTDATYQDKYYREMAPSWLNYVVSTNGGESRNLAKPFNYLELGCGFGHCILTHAGTFPHANFYACDIIPEHIQKAQQLANQFGIENVELLTASFESLLRDHQLPDMDFIVLHGVYSWVGKAARESIKQILANKLKPGGIVYISYNCLPGWAAESPLRKLMVELAQTGTGDAAKRSEQALDSLSSLSEHLAYFKEQKTAQEAIKTYLDQPGNYLAHEFLNDAWETFYSVDIADEMQSVGLHFLASATLVDNHPMLLVNDSTQQKIQSLATERQRQLAYDFAMNKRFRRDVFVAGKPAVDQLTLVKNIQQCTIGCTGSAAAIRDFIQVPRGKIGFYQEFIHNLRLLLTEGPIALGDIATRLGSSDPVETIRNIMFMVAAGELSAFSGLPESSDVTNKKNPSLSLMNQKILDYSVNHIEKRAFPCTAYGAGIEIEIVEAAVLNTWLCGQTETIKLERALAGFIQHNELKLPKKYQQQDQTLKQKIQLIVQYTLEHLIPAWHRLGLIR